MIKKYPKGFWEKLTLQGAVMAAGSGWDVWHCNVKIIIIGK